MKVYFWNCETETWEFLTQVSTETQLFELTKIYPDLRVISDPVIHIEST